MKKRLLSALLAMVMVLAMLPMSAFAAVDGSNASAPADGERVTVSIDPVTGEQTGSYTYKETTTVNRKEVTTTKTNDSWKPITGVLVGTRSNGSSNFSGTYYSTFAAAYEKGTSFILLSDASLPTPADSKSLKNIVVDLNGKSFSLGTVTVNGTDTAAASSANNKSLSSLEFKDYPRIAPNGTAIYAGTVTGTLSINGKAFSVKVTDADANNLSVTLDNTKDADVKHSDTLTINVTGKDGKLGAVVTKNAKGNVTVNAGAVGSVDLGSTGGTSARTGGSITVSNRGTITGDVKIYGAGTLRTSGQATLGDVTLYGGKKGDDNTTAIPNWKTTATIENTTVASITQVADDENGHNITISSSSSVTGAINMSVGGSSTINVTDSSAASVQIAKGTLNIKNSNIAGGVTTGKSDKTSGVTINVGTKGQKDTSTVGAPSVVSGSPTHLLNIYGGTVGAIPSTGFSYEVWGGSIMSRVPRTNLKGGLAEGYEVVTNSQLYTYTTDFQDLVDMYQTYGDRAFTAYRVSDTANTGVPVSFKWDDNTNILTKLTVSAGTFVDLPTVINKTQVNYWYDASDSSDTKGIAAGKQYPVGASATGMTLVAHLNPNTNSTVTAVRAKDKDGTPIACTLNGDTIALSGAVTTIASTANITVEFEVDGAWTSPTTTVNAMWESKTGTITLSDKSGSGVVLPIELSNTVRVFNTTYTVTGAGLKALVPGIVVGGLTATKVTVPNANAGMSGAYAVLGQDTKKELEKSSIVDFSNSNGVKAALNALIAGQTESSLNSIINSARSALASYENKMKIGGISTHKAADYAGYNTVVVTPYLEVAFTNPIVYGDTNNPSTTVTLTLKYRYTVTDGGSSVAYKDIVDGVEVPWEQTGALTAIGDFGHVSITLSVPKALGFTNGATGSNAHHYGYVYSVEVTPNTNTSTLVFNNYNGFSPFELNNNPGKISITEQTGYTFDNVQTAVDAVKNDQHIVVEDDFTGTITVSGQSKQFEINATDNHTVTITGVNGASTTYDYNKNTGSYTIQQTGNAPITNNVSISLASYTNGTASLSASTAAVGSTVTVNLTPAAGYVVGGITAKTNTDANVTLTATGTANQYTFTVPTGATSVTVTPSFVTSGVASIIVNSTAYGTASTSAVGGTAQTGSTVTIYLAPNTGCRTIGVTVRTNTGSGVYVNQVNANQYTFTVPAGAASVTVTPTFDRETGMPFVDVLSTDSYLAYVQYVYNHGMVNGTTTTTFGGNGVITRAQIVTILYRLSGSPAVTGSSTFVDVPAGVYAAPVAWAQANGVVTGTSATTFEPDRAITRQELAAILYRYHVNVRKLAATNLANLNGYTDRGLVAADWAMTPMQWCVGNGIVNGTTTTTLEPNGTAIRYHAATMLTRYCQNILGIQ